MGLGPIVAALGLLLLLRIGPGADYVTDVLPGRDRVRAGDVAHGRAAQRDRAGAAGEARAGVASAVNNAVARVAGLLAVAVIPVAAGITGDDYLVPCAFDDGFEIGLVICAVLCAAGGRAGPRRHPARPRRRPAPATEHPQLLNGPPPGLPHRGAAAAR